MLTRVEAVFMPRRLTQYLHRAFIGLIALCVVGQSLGSTHCGCLCLGCGNILSRIGVVDASYDSGTCCTRYAPNDTSTCCARDTDETEPHQSHDSCDSEGTCDCLDVKLTPSPTIHPRSTTNTSLDDFGSAALIAAPLLTASVDVPSVELHFPARAAPPFVPALSPNARRTILRL